MAEHATQTATRQNAQSTAAQQVSEAVARQHSRPEGGWYEFQKTVGNQAMQRSLLASQSGILGLQRKCASCEQETDDDTTDILQTKLTINQPGDIFEQEADRVADAVMSGGPTRTDLPIGGRAIASVQKNCACGGTCEDCQRNADVVHRLNGSPKVGVDNVPRIVDEVLQSSGQPLEDSTRMSMESSLGADFSGVRVHNDERAGDSASAINALAYTVGRNVVFGKGQFAPGTQSGRHLLAHELVHVVQQTGAHRLESSSPPSSQHSLNSLATKRMLQRACGPAAIGTPADCASSNTDPIGDTVLFIVNCDEFISAAEEKKVVDFADSMQAGDSVVVHGFASIDGDPTFNENLSCARAVKTKSVLTDHAVDPSKISIVKHGAKAGPVGQRRSVILERTPGASRPSVPQLKATVVTAPAGTLCGQELFVIQWSLSRNSAAAGGFVIQDVQFNWTVTDCNGAIIPTPPFTSPLEYFEAWRVPPNSTQPNPTTDQFSWPANPPWAGGCSDGRVAVTATAHYFDNNGAGALPASMSQLNPKTFAGTLFSGLTDPALGGTASRPVSHSLRFHWKCCPCSSSPTVIDSHVP
jgi:outer membrane protein OmpA-like peptidoglycan-associated protein